MSDFETKPVGDTTPAPEQQYHIDAPIAPATTRWGKVKEFYFANKWYVWAITAGVMVIGALGYLAFRPQDAPVKEANVNVLIEAPDVSPSGSEIIYKVKMENNDRATLVNMQLELVYDDGVTYVSSTPKAENAAGTLFDVPNLSTGQNAVVMVKTKAEGNINDEKRLVARLHYRYNNISSEFIKESEHTVRLVAADVSIELTGPESTTNAQVVNYELSYSNNSDHDIENARIEVTFPEGFTFADSNPKPDLGKNIWNLAKVERGRSGKITFQGTFKTAQPGQSQTFKADFLVLDNQGSFFKQSTTEFTTRISVQPLAVTQSLDSRNNIVKPGDTLAFSIKYQNNGNVAATGVNIVVTLDSKALDLNSIRAENGQVNNNTISWNASDVANLERLNPNESGNIRFSVKVKNPVVRDTSRNVTVKSSIKVKSNEYETFLPGNDLELKVATVASLDGDASFVTGQLPLQVGKSSTFQVKLTLKNSTNDLNGAVLTGFVPNGTTFDQASVTAKEAGAVTFDSSTGKLTWKVTQLDAHTGDFNPARILTFNVRVNPSSTQVNRELTLFRNIQFTAKDTFTGENIELKTEDVKTTDIPDGFSSGRVQQ
jgi:hypothetical protein